MKKKKKNITKEKKRKDKKGTERWITTILHFIQTKFIKLMNTEAENITVYNKKIIKNTTPSVTDNRKWKKKIRRASTFNMVAFV